MIPEFLQRKKYTGEWIEPKLLTIYTVDRTGKKIKNGEVPVINDGTYGNYKKLLKILEVYLISLGINQAKEILLIADGADWIWQHIPTLLNRLDCRDFTHYLVDFYHATEHLQDFADAAFSKEYYLSIIYNLGCFESLFILVSKKYLKVFVNGVIMQSPKLLKY